MEKDWMFSSRVSYQYQIGVDNFLEFANRIKDERGFIRCPCRRCGNLRMFEVDEVREHLFKNGIDLTYTKWIWHGESTQAVRPEVNVGRKDARTDFNSESNVNNNEFLGDFSTDGLGDVNLEDDDENMTLPTILDEVIDDVEAPLYKGCDGFTKIGATTRLFSLKARNGLSNKGFSEFLELISDMLPAGNILPRSHYEANKMLASVGMRYTKIHACINGCVLFRNKLEDKDFCPVCKASRWKDSKETSRKRDKVPIKVMWYLPIIPRLLSLFKISSIAKMMTWHKNGENRVIDGKYRHPADSPQWKTLDTSFPEFGYEPRNIRIGLCTDGINPHSNNSSSHSSWPVLLAIYNIPPWLCMKRRFILLTVMIPGPKQPGKNIDVYLQPLIDDLKLLWDKGISAYDAYKKEHFTLRAAVLWTINDYPAYGILSGCVVKGKLACVICGDKTPSCRLKHGRKDVVMGHRKWLARDHKFRRLRKAFNGHQEFDNAPTPLTGKQTKTKLDDFLNGMTLTKSSFKRKTILWELPYWDSLYVRHNLDVMHIEKNIGDALLSTLLNVSGKSKDNLNARLDMVKMGIKRQLAPVINEKGTFLPHACYTFSRNERKEFLKYLSNVKVPDGFSSNIKANVSLQEAKLIHMKSHDYHVFMQQLLPVALKGSLKKEVRVAISRLCFFFNRICSRVINPDELVMLQREIVFTLCVLETYFPPSFFDIMLHLTIHLVREVQLCGPVFARWMYPFERYMKGLKANVRNRFRPEGCMVECYIAEEAVNFCTDFVADRNGTYNDNPIQNISVDGRPLGSPIIEIVSNSLLEKAHLYVLRNAEAAQPYVQEHLDFIRHSIRSRGNIDIWVQAEHCKTFVSWFKQKIKTESETNKEVSEVLKWLSNGPTVHVFKYKGFIQNGFKFSTFDHDANHVVQNSGVSLVAKAMHISSAKDKNPIEVESAYYGVIEEIWELNYVKLRVPIFKCRWVETNGGVKIDELGLKLVDLNRNGHKNDPFILTSQATQVFYLPDRCDPRWSVVLSSKKRGCKGFIADDDEDMEFGTFTGNPLVGSLNIEDDLNYVGEGEGEWIRQ